MTTADNITATTAAFDKVKSLMQDILRSSRTAREIKGIGEVYSYNEWPASIKALPTALIGVVNGNLTYQSSWAGPIQHSVGIWIYFPGVTLAEAMKQAVPIIERVKDKFAANLQLAGNVDNFMPAPGIWYEGPGEIGYGGAEFIGLKFNYLMKMKQSTTAVAIAAGSS